MRAKDVFDRVLSDQRQVYEFLEALDEDKITLEILSDFYYELKSRMIKIDLKHLNKNIFDVCGTGGSGRTRVNLSTILAIKLSRDLNDGFTIAKHANKASSGRVGSIDLLDELKIDVSHNRQEVENSITKNNLAFLFAPYFHPSLAMVRDIRKLINHRTIFNFVMPLLNPIVDLKAQMIGVSSPILIDILADFAFRISKNVIFVHDLQNGLDDVSITGETLVCEVFNGSVKKYSVYPKDFNIKPAKNFSYISGYNDAKQNAILAKSILNNSAPEEYMNFLKINKMVASNFFNKCI